MKNEKNSKAIIFCGLPATLKTFLSVRLSGRIGYAYLPTKAIRSVLGKTDGNVLYQDRLDRYSDLSKIVHSILGFGADVVVDGGFPTSESKKIILNKTNPEHTIIIHCTCDDKTRIKRLGKRANDKSDYESQSAKEILQNVSNRNDSFQEEDPELELKNGKINSMLVVNTSKMSLKWKGNPPKDLSKKVNLIIKDLLKEYKQNETTFLENEIIKHFDSFADEYDDTTEWRKNKKILQSLQTSSIPNPSRVLDIGAGTGLASQWYSEQGHNVTGIDISPKMLQKASERLNFVLLGSGTKLPFINNYFNLILIRQCLHYVETQQLLSEAQRVLNKGGLIIISSAVCPNEDTKNFWREFKNATQPLRLEVFTLADIKKLSKKTGCKFIKEIHCSLIRKEKIDSIKKRARNIPGGLHSFLRNMEKLTSKLFPELEFRIQNDHLIYRQYWVTIWAKKI